MSNNRESHFLRFVKKIFLLRKIFSPGASKRAMTEEELRHALLEGEKSGVVESRERTMVEGVFYLGDRPVSAFMTHRSGIKWLDINADAQSARKAAEEAGSQASLPVADGELDEVAGAVLVQDIYKTLLEGAWPGLKSIMKQPHFIPETMSALKAFEVFKKADANDIFVMDEYGGFAGLLTVRNLIEEIVGELSASGENEESIVKQEDGAWLADGNVSIDDASRELGLDQLGGEQNEYHTLAGFILYLAGEIPREGAYFDYSGYRFKVVDMDNNRIDKILITALTPP
jgi:putative hemolysin